MNILITGASSGIGAQLARDYLAENHRVYACGRNRERLQQLSQRADDQLEVLEFDVSDRQAVQRALQDIGPVDIVVLNAGTCEYIDDAQHFSAELVDRVFAANFQGFVYCAEALLPQLKAGSQLVVVDSMARLLPFSRAQAYGASKAAVHYFANSLKTDLAPAGITVQTVSPGFVKTPLTDKNDFAMPMRVSVATASAAIRRGIKKRHGQIWFPRVFGWMLRGLNRLPIGCQVWLSRRMKG